MDTNESVTLVRDVEAAMVPAGTPVTLEKGVSARITQSLGGTYTVVVNGNMFRIDSRNADALGLKPETPSAAPATEAGPGKSTTPEDLEKQVWDELKNVYDPEIPVNIVDLGLVYDCTVSPLGTDNTFKVHVRMTLTAPGCGMGPMIAQDAQNRLLSLEPVDEAEVELVWDPPWNQDMLSETAKLQLGLM